MFSNLWFQIYFLIKIKNVFTLHIFVVLGSDERNEDKSGGDIGNINSDSSDDGEALKCAICFLKFKGQAIGFPELCDHPFCLDCILEWTKQVIVIHFIKKKNTILNFLFTECSSNMPFRSPGIPKYFGQVGVRRRSSSNNTR